MAATTKTFYVYVATAGIGWMGFGAWVGDEKIDRGDGDDADTYASLRDALVAAGERLERMMYRHAWHPTNKLYSKRRKILGSNIHLVEVTYSFNKVWAKWVDVFEDSVGYEAVQGDSPAKVLGELGEATERMLAHRAWVERLHG